MTAAVETFTVFCTCKMPAEAADDLLDELNVCVLCGFQWKTPEQLVAEFDPTPCCLDPGCGRNPCTFPGYADNH